MGIDLGALWTLASLFVAAGLAALAFYGVPRLWRARAVAALDARCREGRLLALTYDDGPNPELTPALLDLLERSGASASFFPKGVAAESGRGVLDRAAGAGHELGCHSHAHRHAWKTLPPTALRDALAGYETLSPWVGRDGLYRAPYGKIDLLTWLWLARRGVRQAWWTVDSGDTWAELPTVESTLERVRRAGGGVVLMHDLHPEGPRRQYVLELTKGLLEMAAREQLTCVPIGSLIAADRSAPAG